MTAPKREADYSAVDHVLDEWISRTADEEGIEWIRKKRSELESDSPEWKFFAAFSAVPRFLGKSDLELSAEDLERADDARHGWNPSTWSVDQAGRTFMVLAARNAQSGAFLALLDKVFSTADVGESVALYQSLPVLPHPELLADRAAEGVRSNMSSVFNAVALDNPFPSEYLDDSAWNQMVLKAVFVGSPLHRIQGIDGRANPELARMLVDYARERRAASRPVTPELWRPVGPFVDDRLIEDVAKTLESDRQADREAAALALHASDFDSAREILDRAPELRRQVESGRLTWESFSRTEE